VVLHRHLWLYVYPCFSHQYHADHFRDLLPELELVLPLASLAFPVPLVPLVFLAAMVVSLPTSASSMQRLIIK
jgi:hypothetical protein